MIALDLIGIGTGNPEHVTLAGVRAMRSADLILIPRKGPDKADLAELRREICEAALEGVPEAGEVQVAEFDLPVRDASGDYLAGVNDWHDAIARAWLAAVEAARPGAGRVALLIWGDPSLYDSSLRIAARLGDVRVKVVPGITALQALTAAHGIAVNEIGAPFIVTTGRRLRAEGWPEGGDTVAVMLDSGGAFQGLDPEGIEIWWGAYLGMAEELLISGPLADKSAEILSTREEARARHGWIMDIYLMRRRG